jgi:hypothetical protein
MPVHLPPIIDLLSVILPVMPLYDMVKVAQGVERTLRFLPVGEMVEMECLSRTSWKPNPLPDLTTLTSSRTCATARFIGSSIEIVQLWTRTAATLVST